MDVFGAANRSWGSTHGALLRPFNIGTWLAFGFVSFLASLIDPSGGYSGRPGMPGGGGGGRGGGAGAPMPDLGEGLHGLREHSELLVMLGITALVVGAVVGLALMWVGCRGLMIAYRSVSLGHVAIGEGWRETRAPANALFRTYALFSVLSFVVIVPLAVLAVFRGLSLYDEGERDIAIYATALVPHLIVMSVAGVLAMLVGFVLRNFIAPYLLFFRCTAREAWGRFFTVLRAHPGAVIVFLFARAVLAIVIGIFSTIVSTCTCCIGGLPVLHQSLLAPVYFFDRAFTLHALATLDDEHAGLAPA
jgi:hypothetical protein